MNAFAHKLKFAVLDCGRIADRHAFEIAKVGKIVACVDTDRHRVVDYSKKLAGNRTHPANLFLRNKSKKQTLPSFAPLTIFTLASPF